MCVTPQRGAPKKGGLRQVPRSPPLKHTTARSLLSNRALTLICSGDKIIVTCSCT